MSKLRLISITIFLLLLVSSLSILSACSDTEETTSATTSTSTTTSPADENDKYGGTLTVIYPYMGTALGWPALSGGGYAMYQQICLEPLLQQMMDGTIVPRLATEYSIGEDNSITFTLRQNVKFHDGSDFNANVAKFNFDEMMAESKGNTINWESVEVIDEYTIKVTYATWANWAIADFTYSGNLFMVSQAAYDENGVDWIKNNMVGTGAFKQADWEQDVSIVFDKNTDYWQDGKPYVDKLVVQCIGDPMTAQANMLSGDADILQTEADQKVVDMQDQGLEAITRPVGVMDLFPDSANPSSPFSSLKVREAFEYAINKDAIAQTLCGGLLSPAYQMAPPNVSAYVSDIVGRKYDPEKAKALLTEAGYPDGFKITIVPCPVPMFTDTAVAIQADLAAVGIGADVQMVTDAKFFEYVTGDFSDTAVLAAVSSPLPNWVQSLSTFLNPEGILYAPTEKTSEFTTAFNEAAYTLDYDAAKAQALIKQMYDDQTVIPLFNAAEAWVFQSYVKDAWTPWPSSLWMWSPENAWLDK